MKLFVVYDFDFCIILHIYIYIYIYIYIVFVLVIMMTWSPKPCLPEPSSNEGFVDDAAIFCSFLGNVG